MDLPHRSRGTAPALFALLVAGLCAGCFEDPSHGELAYDLGESTHEALKDWPEARAHVAGSLEMLFGTPDAPAFMLTEDWIDDGYDPNWPSYPEGDRGSGEFSDEEWERIVEGNLASFGRQLAAIEREDYDAVPKVLAAPRLNERWGDLLAQREELGEDFQEEARLLFAEYYPTLRDSAELYRQQCLHCHGVEGGGDGPTAPYLDPLPRDYRLGVFKFTAVGNKKRPRREDIYRILDEGVYTTAMPSFRRFSPAQLHGLVDYVRLLSMRGMVENDLVYELTEEGSISPERVQEVYTEVWGDWLEADENYIAFEGEIPAATPELIARGRELFNDAAKGNCASCHGPQGIGDGAAAYKTLDNGDVVPAYEDDWGHPILPRDLTRGVFRGGRRPIDIYRRIYAGISGGPMPGLGESKDAEGNPLLSDEDMWALVHYVRSIAERPQPVLAGHSGAGHGDGGHGDDGHGAGDGDAGDGATGEPSGSDGGHGL